MGQRQAIVRLSAKEVGVVVIDSDSDSDDDGNDGDTGFEIGGKANGEDGEDEDAALDFNTFDYWRR
jgi:hypothetical protein